MIANLPTSKAYLSAITVTDISHRDFTYMMSAKIKWARYGTKLRRCHPVYICVCCCSIQCWRACHRSWTSATVSWVSRLWRVWCSASRRVATARTRPSGSASRTTPKNSYRVSTLLCSRGLLLHQGRKKGTNFLLCASLLILDRKWWIFFVYIKEYISYNSVYLFLACIWEFFA